MEILNRIKKRFRRNRGNRNITRSRVLYLYVIFSGISMFVYAISCIFTGWPFWYTLLPIYGLAAYFLWIFIKKNSKMFWLYINDMDQGLLHLALTDMTHFGEQNKVRLVQWVYPKKNQVRNETWLRLGEKVRTGQALTKDEKRQAKKKVVTCPQQVLDGVSKAILINCLIYAHKNIHVLDDEIREILELTDENMANFNMQVEIDRCRTEEYRKDIERRLEIGRKNMQRES